MKRVLALAAVCVVTVSGCTSARRPAPRTITSTTEITETLTRSPSTTVVPVPSYRAPVPRTVAPLPPGAKPAKGEVERRCPYIASTPEQDPTTNVADIDGSHVYRTTVVTTHRPVGCRFYFYSSPFYAIVDIEPKRFASARAAYAAMIATARRGTDVSGKPDIVPGIDGILYRTAFYSADGKRDWACVFAAGATMVIVRTQRTDTSLNALLLARAVARRF